MGKLRQGHCLGGDRGFLVPSGGTLGTGSAASGSVLMSPRPRGRKVGEKRGYDGVRDLEVRRFSEKVH